MACIGNLTFELNGRTNKVNRSETVKKLHKLNPKTVAGITGEDHQEAFTLVQKARGC